MFDAHETVRDRWAIILAGGDGRRLASLTRRMAGREIPKQFYPVVGNHTLLHQTRLRTSALIPSERTLVSVVGAHERFYTPLLRDMPPDNIVVQPRNRGTAPAILYSLLRLSAVSPDATVAIFPSDHYVDDDMVFMNHVAVAFNAARRYPWLTVLLGITPERPEVGYGWIEPAERVPFDQAPVFHVLRFWEKPSLELARQLCVSGCLWNSFVIVAQIPALLSLIMATLPRLYCAFAAIRPSIGTIFEEATVGRLYADIGSENFSQQVLEKSPETLAVLPVRGVGWSDLGEPQRVLEALARIDSRPSDGAA